MENPQVVKLIKVKRTKTLANGTKKEYTETQKRVLKGYVRADGTRVQKTIFSEEQQNEIKRKHAEGVSPKRLITDYNCTYSQLKKITG